MRTLLDFDAEAERLLAREQLALASVIAVGTGSLEEADAKAWRRETEEAAGVKRRVGRAASQEQHIANLQAEGIGVEMIPVSAEVVAARLAERDRVLAERAAAAGAAG